MSLADRVDACLLGINAEALSVLPCCVRYVFFRWMVMFKLPVKNPHTLMYNWCLWLSVWPSRHLFAHTLHMHWFWVIPLLHPWLLKTQRGPLGSWSGLWILKLVGPRRTASLRCVSSLAAVAHLAGRWLTASKRAQRQHWMCDLCTFASQQESYS